MGWPLLEPLPSMPSSRGFKEVVACSTYVPPWMAMIVIGLPRPELGASESVSLLGVVGGGGNDGRERPAGWLSMIWRFAAVSGSTVGNL